VADLMASHITLDGAALLIEGARNPAPGISTGAVAVFRAFQRARHGRGSPAAAPCVPSMHTGVCCLYVYIYCAFGWRPG
jgi:hypothetical protein